MSRASVLNQLKGETPTAVGNGFKIYSINTNGGERDVIVINHAVLVQQVHAAEKYAAKNGGNLPNTRFWNLTASIFREDKALFRELHQCRELLSLLRRDATYDAAHPTPLTPAPQVLNPQNPVRGRDTSPDSPVVPEPASALLMGVGLVALLVLGHLKLAGRRTPSPAV